MRPASLLCLSATDQQGDAVSIPISDVLGLAPDEDRSDATILFLAGGTAQVDEDYETLIDRIAACWLPERPVFG